MSLSASRPRRTARIALRSAQLLWAASIAAGVFFASAVRNAGSGRRGAYRAAGRALRVLCARLGATFIKVGQIASTRADLLPRETILELAKLQDALPSFPFQRVRQTLEAGLERRLEDVYSEFQREPVAAASIAQVHRARLRTPGPEADPLVAVKVRRPDIVERVELDRSLLLFVAHGLERMVPSLRMISIADAMETFCAGVEEQLRLDVELENAERFRDNFADDPEIHFPAVYRQASGTDFITMEFVAGVHERDLEARGVEPRRIAVAGMRAVCRMIFLHGFVHADLHPGNLRFDAPCRLVMLDLGLVGRLEDEDRITFAKLLFAFALGDGKTVAELFYVNAPHTAVSSYASYEAEVSEFVESVRRKGLGNVEVTLEVARIFDILRRHRVQARAHMTMVNLAMMTAEGLGKRLAPELTLTLEALPYLAEALGVSVPGRDTAVTHEPRAAGLEA